MRLIPFLSSLAILFTLGFTIAPESLSGQSPPAREVGTSPASYAMKAADFSTMTVGDRVKVVLAKGELEGTVLEITAVSIRLKTKYGIQTIRKADITSWEKFRTLLEQFEEKAAKCTTPDDWCDLGDWADAQEDEPLAIRAFREATKLDADHARARKALNEEKVEGEWLPFDEAQRARGLDYYDGKWRTLEEIALLKEKEDEDTTTEKTKGREQLALEYRGRPWAEIDPIETQHYYIWCNSTIEIAEYYADVMEALYKRYDQVFPDKYFPRNSRKKSTVYIHSNHQQFRDWTSMEMGIGGFYQPWNRDVTAYHGSFGTTGSTEEVLAHEGTHQFQGLIFDNMSALPTWFIEGLAVYFGDGSKISRRKVEINEIPRDRLIGLKQAIEDGTYCDLRKLLMIPQRQFGGFYYGHGWGIIYWCLWGDKMGAKNKGVGLPLMDDWLLKCREESKREGFCDYPKMSKHFVQLLEQHTGKSLEAWEEEYKEWILGLPVEEVGKKRGNKWTSEALKLEVTKPVGWQWEKENNLSANEVIAAKGPGRAARRVSTFCWPNWDHAPMDPAYARRLTGSIFQSMDPEVEFTIETVGGYPGAIRARFKAQRVLKAESSLDENGRPTTNTELGDELQYDVVFFGSVDKNYCSVFECDPAVWDDNSRHFEKYLADFHTDN